MVRHSPGQHHALSTPKLTRLFPGALLVFFILLGWEVPAGASSQITYDLYLPVVFASGMPCPIDSLINGDFEADDLGWTLYTTGIDWKAHDLVGSIAEGFSPHQGYYAARLGGYEGVYDWIEQPITIPAQTTLSYWWRLGTYEPAEPPHDNFLIELLQDDGTRLAVLAAHHDREPEGVWAQDMIDLNSYAGRTLKLRFSSYNDNYYFSWFDLDEVKLCAWE